MALQDAYKIFETGQAEASEWFENEIRTLRTGRAIPDMVNNIAVEHYGTRTPVQGVASVANADARTLVITPWDASAIPAIEKALIHAELGAQPTVDGQLIRLIFPTMSEETREQTVRTLHKKAEEARVRLRQARDEALSLITKEKQSSDITEDDFYGGKRELNVRIDAANREIETAVKGKEESIRQL